MSTQLVAKNSQVQDAESSSQFLSFILADEMYAISIRHAKEILEYGAMTTVPMMPAFIRGVINLRGSVVPVVDLGVRFGRERRPITKKTCIIITEIENEGVLMDIGIVVDLVSEVLDISSNDVEPTPSFGNKIRSDFIEGMGKVNGQFVIILDVGQVLSIQELSTLEKLKDGEEC